MQPCHAQRLKGVDVSEDLISLSDGLNWLWLQIASDWNVWMLNARLSKVNPAQSLLVQFLALLE